MAHSTFWWLVSGATIVLELLSGTIYLLLLGTGFAAAALVAHAGFGLGAQITAAAAVGLGAMAAWWAIRRRRPAAPPSRANRDVNLDIGSRIQIERWRDDGTASVRYRGAQWTAVARDGAAPVTGEHRVDEIVGSRLVVSHVPRA